MALTFFWRCETTTLNATHDFTAGDNTAGPNNSVVLDAAAAMRGSLGVLAAANGRYYQFSGVNIWERIVGSAAISLRVSALPTAGGRFLYAQGVDTGNFIDISADDGAGHLRMRHLGTGPGASGFLALPAAISINTWYGIVIRWSDILSSRAIELYSEGGVAAISSASAGTYTPPAELAGNFRVGNGNVTDVTSHVDNVFVSDVYDEPLQDYLGITSYTEYGVAPGGLIAPFHGKFGGLLTGRL